jgi:hypothetical protein
MTRKISLTPAFSCLVWMGLVLAGAGTHVLHAAAPSVYYVSPDGSDTGDGSMIKPFASLPRARDAARTSKIPRPRIVLRGGDYFVRETISFDGRDSGLTIEAAPGEKPVLFGGEIHGGWESESDGIWSMKLPSKKSGLWDFRMLVVDGRICPASRLPREGSFEHLTEFPVRWLAASQGGWEQKPTVAQLTRLRYKAGDLGPWLDTASAEVTIYHLWDESRVGIAGHDTDSQTLTFTSPATHPPGGFNVKKYVVWNCKQGLTEPGQWYLDKSVGKLFYRPRAGEDISRAKAFVPLVDSIFQFEGTAEVPVRDVTIRGLALTLTSTPLKSGGFGAGEYPGALEVNAAVDFHIRDLEVFQTAGQGIRVRAGKRVLVDGCEVRQTGACGIRVDTDSQDSVLSNNIVHHTGLLFPSAIGVMVSGNKNHVIHNEIRDTSYSGISASGDENLIQANLVERPMLTLHDGAGIYVTYGVNISITGNVVREIPAQADAPSAAYAYYIDEQASDCRLDGNLSVGCNDLLMLHMGSGHTVRNNIFISSGDARIWIVRTTGVKLDLNIIQADGDIVFRLGNDAISSMPDNILWSLTGKILLEKVADDYKRETPVSFELREGTIHANPDFTDLFRGVLSPDSPALKLGIQPLDLETVGRLAQPSGTNKR